MIKDVAKDILRLFEVNRFVETGIHDGETIAIVKQWFGELYGRSEGNNNSEEYSVICIDMDKERCDNATEKLAVNNCDESIVNGSSIDYLRQSMSEGEFGDGGHCMFYLNACSDDYVLLQNEIREVLRLEKSIILIDNFYTPGKPFEYAIHKGMRLDLNCIREETGSRADCIYYAAIANRDNRGMAMIITGYDQAERDGKLKGLPLIRERLDNGELSLLGKSGRVLMMGLGRHRVRSNIPNLAFENYISGCMSGYEIITFGYNEGVDIQMQIDDDFTKVLDSLPNRWLPDICILAGCEYGLLPPRGIENAPFLTAYISYDWDYHVLTTRTFAEIVDITISDGDFSVNTLNALDANRVDQFYVHGIMSELFNASPKKIKDRKYDIVYATAIDDVRLLDRSEWVLKICELADTYKIHIASHSTYYSYLELLNDAKLAFSYTKLGEMSPRIFDAASQGAVTLHTGHAVKKYFKEDREVISVTRENIEEQVKKCLEDQDRLQGIADRVYAKVADSFEPRKRFVELVERLSEQTADGKNSTRKFNGLPDSEKHIRWGELYYFAFWVSVDKWGWLNDFKKLLKMSIAEFRKAVNIEPSERAMLDLAVTEASWCCYDKADDNLNEKVKGVVGLFEQIISEYPSYAAAYFNLGLLLLRTGDYDRALSVFTTSLKYFEDTDSHVDPWCLYHTELEPDLKSGFIFGKAHNSNIVMSCTDSKEAIQNMRKIYQAAAYYYLSVLYDETGGTHNFLDSLLKSYHVYPDSAVVAVQAAKRLAILDFRKESIEIYRNAIMLLPFNVDLRIEFVKLLYLYGMDSDAMKEINFVLTIIKKVQTYRERAGILNRTIEYLDRYDKTSGYSHDSCKEELLNGWVESLYVFLRKNPNNLNLVLRIIEIWHELGRVDKIFEIVDNYIDNHMNKNITDKEILAIRDVYDYLQKVCEVSERGFTKKLNKLSGLISNIQTSSNLTN